MSDGLNACSHIGCAITKSVGAWSCTSCGATLAEHPAAEIASLRADLARVTAERDEARKALAVASGGCAYEANLVEALRAELDVALMSLHAAAGEQTAAAAEEYLAGEAKCWQCGERVEAQGGRWSCRCGREWTADGVIREGR